MNERSEDSTTSGRFPCITLLSGMFDVDSARELLTKADVFFGRCDEEDGPEWEQTLNMNDTWAWACADGEYVSDEELPRVAELFWRYGHCGILFWVSEKNNGMRSEFYDINRFVDFVRQEEAIRADVPESSKRAYAKREYSLGG